MYKVLLLCMRTMEGLLHACLRRSHGLVQPNVKANWLVFACSLFCVVGSTSIARADSFFDALVSAYLSNPGLEAARAGLRATDEEVPIAKSGARPTIIGTGEYGYLNRESDPGLATDIEDSAKTLAVELSQPIFRGFRVVNSVRAAEANVRAGRQELKSQEQATLLAAATAYMNVVQDTTIVRLRKRNAAVLTEQLKGARDRRKFGLGTMTDISQARARLAVAVADLSRAKANLDASKANYVSVVRKDPNNLRNPGNLGHVVPQSLDQAIIVGIDENPEIIAADFRAKAARHSIDTNRGFLLPQIDLEASYRKNYDPSGVTDEAETTTVLGRLTVPFYQGGEAAARVRQSKHVFKQRIDELSDVRNRVRSQIYASWSRLRSARSQLKSAKVAEEANDSALEGVKEEQAAGRRTLLDVLDAEVELLNASIAVAQTRRDIVLATFDLLAAVGRLTAQDLGLPVSVYDPEEHYNAVRRKWFGTGPRVPRH